MFNGDSLSNALHAIATGFDNRARHLVLTSDELDDTERQRLSDIVHDETATPAEQVRRIGDVVRELAHDRTLANECYRLAFYLDAHAADLSANPLFNYFTAHRSGRLLDKWPHYFAVYHRHLDRFRGRSPRILEIGVFQGGSLDMWQRYFGPGTTLIGIDVDPTAARLADPRLTVEIGDQADADFLRTVVERHGPFDIIIDDGGHTMEQQITSIETLFDGLVDGGVYLVEDCHTSYWDEYEGGRGRAGTFIEWTKERIDDLHGYHMTDPVAPVWTDHVDAIHCYDSVVVFDKARRFAPFAEQVGTSEFVFFSRPTSDLVGEMLATRDAALAERDLANGQLEEIRESIDEELRITRGEVSSLRPRAEELGTEIRRLQTELDVARNDLLEAWAQIRAIRHSLSWRVTTPLRLVRRRMGGRS